MDQLEGILHTLHNIEFLLRSLNDKHEKELVLLKEIATQAKPKKMLNHKEAAAFLGIHPSRLQVIVAEERIPVYRIGTKKLYKHSDLEAWLETRASKKINP